MILMIDNYDSFTYNLVQYLEMLGEVVAVRRNDAISLAEIERMDPDMIVLSPGPGSPAEAGICLAIIEEFRERFAILGICLGHQTLAQGLGARIRRAREPVHGKVHAVRHGGKGVFAGLPDPVPATRYHSLAVDGDSLPPELEMTAWTADGEIMGLMHRRLPLEGIQFHPEAIKTAYGMEMLDNFLQRARMHAMNKKEDRDGC